MDDKKREIENLVVSINDDDTITTFGDVISEAGYVLADADYLKTLGNELQAEARKDQRAKDAAIVRADKFIRPDGLLEMEYNAKLERLAQRVEAQTDAE